MDDGRAAPMGGQPSVAPAVEVVRRAGADSPSWAVIAGSGLSGLAESLDDAVRIPYRSIPGWPAASVAGHAGLLAVGRLRGHTVAVAAGRAHLYEGHPPQALAFGLRVMHALGARNLIVTNAAGGLNPAFEAGEVMVIRDHIFLPGLMGASPLVGPNDDRLGPRFPSLIDAYDPLLSAAAREALLRNGLGMREGVYVMAAGPTYETPAEARFLRAIGADAVGMSTAPEVVAARHAGMRVLGLSLITNKVLMSTGQGGGPVAADASMPQEGLVPDSALDGEALHAEVTDVGAQAAPLLARAIADVIAAS